MGRRKLENKLVVKTFRIEESVWEQYRKKFPKASSRIRSLILKDMENS